MTDQAASNRIYENDVWTLELEELGFDREARELSKMIIRCRPPFAISVRGRWGSGKTSIMRYAMASLGAEEDPIRLPLQRKEVADTNYQADKNTLDGLKAGGRGELEEAQLVSLDQLYGEQASSGDDGKRARLTCIWFSPWRYQNDPNPMVPLLQTLRHHFSHWAQTRNALGKVGRAVVEAGLETLGHLADSAAGLFGFRTKAFSELPKAARSALERLDSEQLVAPTDTERFNLLFEHAIGTLLGVRSEGPDSDHAGEAKHRLVVFIDDLDRCEGETAVRMLEAIKLYLSTKHCVFVFGVDPTALEHEIHNHWRDRPHGMACEYLEKMFQASVIVPTSDRYDRFIHRRLVRERALVETENGESTPVARALAKVLEPNPRKVKNFLNSLFLALGIYGVGLSPEDLLRFALIQRLKLTAPNTYKLLAQGRVEQHDTLRTFFAACTAPTHMDTPRHLIGFRDLAIYKSEFGHIMRPNNFEHAKVEEADLIVRIDRIRADHELAKIWHEDGILNEYSMFCRLAGVEMEPPRDTTPAVAADTGVRR